MAGHAVEPDSLDFFFFFFFFFYFLLMLCLSCSRGPFCLTEAEARLWAIKVRCPGTHVKVGELSAKEVCKIHATHTTHAAEAAHAITHAHAIATRHRATHAVARARHHRRRLLVNVHLLWRHLLWVARLSRES